MSDIDEIFEARLDAALAHTPPVTIPAGFAARVTAQVSQRPAQTWAVRRSFAQRGLWLALVLLVMAITLAALAGLDARGGTLVESMLAVELAVVAVWIGRNVQASR